jgi:Zn ribbon nucleic-acid-binding protein
MTTDPCPACKSAKTVLVAPTEVVETVAQRCTECGLGWSVPLSLRAAVRLDHETRQSER